MGRTVDPDVHGSFVEFRAKDDDKCLSVQCIYCQQIRAKNTSRQKQHLLECPGLRGQATPAGAPPGPANGIGATNGFGPPNTPGQPSIGNTNGPIAPNGVNARSTPIQTLQNRPPVPTPTPGSAQGPPSVSQATPSRQLQTPKPPKPQKTPSSNLPAPPLDDVHAAFVEFRAKDEDKCLSVQCIYCQQVRAKNTSRQRQHLLECPTYLNVMKDSIPANNLLHTFPEGNIARSLQIPTPALELDFRMSVMLHPRIPVGQTPFGQRNWISFIGGQWAGRWGKGTVVPGGQDNQLVVKDLATKMETQYLLQTSDEPPAYITINTDGWRTGSRDVLEKLADPTQADMVNPNSYKFRLTIAMETGDERYGWVNTAMWVGSGCRRAQEVIYDAYRIT